MTYDQQCRRLVTFIKQLGVGFAGVARRPEIKKGEGSWTFVIYLPPDHVVSATGPEQPIAPKSIAKRRA
jgi:hypothetical protein